MNQLLFNCLNLTNTKYFYETDHDVLIIWSCDIGEKAIFYKDTGSLFTYVLCKVLAKLQSGTQPTITEIVSDTSKAVETAIRSRRQQGLDDDYQSPQCEQINMDNMDIILKKGL